MLNPPTPTVHDIASQDPTGIQPHWLALSLPAVPMWVRQWNGMQTIVTRLKNLDNGPLLRSLWPSLPSLQAPTLLSVRLMHQAHSHLPPGLCPCCSLNPDTLPSDLSLVSSQPAGSRWNDTLSQWALLTSLLSNFHSTLRPSLSHHPCLFSS